MGIDGKRAHSTEVGRGWKGLEDEDKADAHDASIAQVALNWLLRFDGVFPIPGAKSPEQAEGNVSSAEWRMSEEEWRGLTEAPGQLSLDYFFDFDSFA